jgi:uncharacterized protein (TIGR00251 family)
MAGWIVDTLNWRQSGQGITFSVKVVPRARRDEIVGVEDGAVKVRLNAPPVEGKANAALVKFLAQTFGVKQADVQILRGENARHKLVSVWGVTGEKFRELFGTEGTQGKPMETQ